ncbi:MAG: hypothetical protein HN833_03315 [Elusimicrobiaceae bacterium]|nr:hypothetical protein [Elusimicrobiaceae bacterium]
MRKFQGIHTGYQLLMTYSVLAPCHILTLKEFICYYMTKAVEIYEEK